ncbi:GTP pyrophosphokinase [Micromonospora zamorensis]|uniref:GTP pyrophosphokinase n=1 Tax=Micromonospora zamorensis TaxID=709883 RepID=UPI0033F8948F
MIVHEVEGVSSEKASKLLRHYMSERHRYVEFASSMERLLGQLLSSANNHVEITARAKDPESLQQKLSIKRYDSLQLIPDLAGIRIVTSYTSDLRAICEIVRSEFDVIEEVPHGFGQPDAFGYASQHMIVRLTGNRSTLAEWITMADLHCEIQVRTIMQHAWASISHALDYKTDQEIPGEVKRKLHQVAALIEVSDSLFDSFRADVEALREHYATVSSAEGWRLLPVNHDALEATLGKISIAGIAAKIEALHLPVNGVGDIGSLSSKQKEVLSGEISAIAERAALLGIKTMGELDAALNQPQAIQVWADFLPSYVKEAREKKMRLYPLRHEFVIALTLKMLSYRKAKQGVARRAVPKPSADPTTVAPQRKKPTARD